MYGANLVVVLGDGSIESCTPVAVAGCYHNDEPCQGNSREQNTATSSYFATSKTRVDCEVPLCESR